MCPFCDLASDSEKSRVIRKSKLTTTCLSDPSLVKWHTLVIPNRHVEKPDELTSDEILAIFDEIKWVESRLLSSDLADGVDIRGRCRPFLPQGRIKIDHVHFHVLPRTKDDELYRKAMINEIEMFESLSDNEQEQIHKLFDT